MKKYINLVLVIIWMSVIFIMSSFNATESTEQSNTIVLWICNLLSISNTHIVTLIVRKLAHFSEYFILGVLLYNLVKSFGKKAIFAVIICIIYAISDEVHQCFIPGREGKVIDVLIDTFGGTVGIYLIKTYTYLTKSKK